MSPFDHDRIAITIMSAAALGGAAYFALRIGRMIYFAICNDPL